MDTKFVTVVVDATGRKQRVPAHYLDNPRLSRGISLPPSARGPEGTAGQPSDESGGDGEPSLAWSRKQLDEHALGLGIDPVGLRTKDDVLAAIADHQTPAPDPGEGQTPEPGD